MAKKRKVSRNTEPSGPREVDAKDARLTIRTYEDVAGEQDEYWANKDRIDFDSDNDQPRSKRLKKEDDFLEVSDEEVFAQDETDEESEEETKFPAKKKAGKKAPLETYSEDEEKGGEDEEGDEGWWGASKKEYYNADTIETEADALEEEAEAKRLQAKKLAKMQEEDFAFDEDEWLAPKDAAGEDAETVTEVLKEVEIREDMTPEERYKLLQARYPEFDYLVDEFRELQPLLASLQKEAEGKPAQSLEVAKSWILGCYVASLASYFAVLTSPTRDGDGSAKTLSPTELRDHEVMETLVECREAWLKVKQFKAVTTVSVDDDDDMVSEAEDEDMEMMDVDSPVQKKTKKLSKAQLKAQEQKEIEKARKAKAAKKSLANLDKLLKGAKISTKEESFRRAVADSDDHSDFGEEETLDAHTAADKAKRKKSLKFYTSQIVQKASKRAGAGRDAGGDVDIPYRERLRDRQARLNAEAERRGKKDSKHGAALGEGDSDGEDADVAKKVRGDGDDEYYDMVAAKAQSKREDKAARFEALAKARKGERIVEAEELGPDGKRQITYQIQKNKGLTPHRKKAVRNPRVKKRMMFEDKKKKLRSVKAVYKGGEGKGGYQGELSGIKTGLVKSTKL
ncbi:Sas10 C-terminal domain-containing protein [Podospora fimiseda]|uniref:Sas10 C-terminal domain-containing protein n=1 Tax=Podospora fimiseda TaxID=252190 RepID=A0AAN7BR48_9PEZI|nr:Sas10 C-terminal domain-containing protein [Podospora fimiseda]